MDEKGSIAAHRQSKATSSPTFQMDMEVGPEQAKELMLETIVSVPMFDTAYDALDLMVRILGKETIEAALATIMAPIPPGKKATYLCQCECHWNPHPSDHDAPPYQTPGIRVSSTNELFSAGWTRHFRMAPNGKWEGYMLCPECSKGNHDGERRVTC